MKTKVVWNTPSAEREKLVALQPLISLNKRHESKKSKLDKIKKRKGDKSNDERGGKKQKDKMKKPALFTKRPKDNELTKPREWNGYVEH